MDRDEIERIKAENPIAEVVSRYIPLRGGGRTLSGHCPFHDDRKASFVVYPESGRWWCFACNFGGDVIEFIQRIEGVSFKEALEILGGGKLPEPKRSTPTPRRWRRPPGRERGPKLDKEDYRVLKAAAVFYHTAIFANRRALRYVLSRGISLPTIRRCMVGYARGDRLARYLSFKGLPLERAHDLGLLTPYGEFFRERVIVPEWDRSGRIIHMGGRTLMGEEPKYLFLPGLPKPLYGLRQLREEAVFVVEGIFDYLTLLDWGYQAVCLLGSHLKEEYIHLLRRYPVYLALDNDQAGRAAARELAKRLPGAKIISLPEGVKDPNELGQREDGREIFAELVKRAI